MFDWAKELQILLNLNQSAVMVSIVQVKGSTPREVGTKLIVTSEKTIGTIGGGNLEHQSIKVAQNLLLKKPKQTHQIEHFSLSAGLGMCCGGSLEILFERLNFSDLSWLEPWVNCQQQKQDAILLSVLSKDQPTKKRVLLKNELLGGQKPALTKFLTHNVLEMAINMCNSSKFHDQTQYFNTQNGPAIWLESSPKTLKTLFLFGAGHVGQAVASLLANLDWNIEWLDSRDNCVEAQAIADSSTNISLHETDTPEADIDQAESGCDYLVMTHDHSLDFKLCQQILLKGDFNYFGVIGSKTKRKRFEHRLIDLGFSLEQLNKMQCPIGISGIHSKQPYAIAISVVSQLLRYSDPNYLKLSDAKDDNRMFYHSN